MKKDTFGHRIVGGNNAISSIPWQVLIKGTVYILEQQDFNYYLPLVHSIPSWLVWAEIECAMYFALPKWPINQLKPVQLDRQQMLRAYCSNINSV